MFIEKDKSKEVIKLIKKELTLETKRGLYFYLKNYKILTIGKQFKHSYTWKINDFVNDSFLLSINNSYETQVNGSIGSKSLVKSHIQTKHNAILIKTYLDIPDLIIRPSSFKDRFANVFKNFDVKLTNRSRFNHLFILESNASVKVLDKIINKTITNLLIKYKGFYLEIQNAIILMKFEKSINKEDSFNLIKVAKTIDLEFYKLGHNKNEKKT